MTQKPMGNNWASNFLYPLVNSHFAMERSTIFYGKIHYFYGHFQLLFVCSPEGKSTLFSRTPRLSWTAASQVPIAIKKLQETLQQTCDPQLPCGPLGCRLKWDLAQNPMVRNHWKIGKLIQVIVEF